MTKHIGRNVKIPQEKRVAIVETAIDQLKKGDGVTKIALAMNIPRSTLRSLLTNDALYNEYKEKQKKVLDAEFSKIALKSIKHARGKLKDSSYSQAILGAAIAHDKTYPQHLMAQQINVGDKKIEVNMPTFFKTRSKQNKQG